MSSFQEGNTKKIEKSSIIIMSWLIITSIKYEYCKCKTIPKQIKFFFLISITTENSYKLNLKNLEHINASF